MSQFFLTIALGILTSGGVRAAIPNPSFHLVYANRAAGCELRLDESYDRTREYRVTINKNGLRQPNDVSVNIVSDQTTLTLFQDNYGKSLAVVFDASDVSGKKLSSVTFVDERHRTVTCNNLILIEQGKRD